jgi:hypothetical protein
MKTSARRIARALADPDPKAPIGWRFHATQRAVGIDALSMLFRCARCADFLCLHAVDGASPEQIEEQMAFARKALCQCRRDEWPHPKWRTLQPGITVAPAEREGSETPKNEFRVVHAIDWTGHEPRVAFAGETEITWHELEYWTTEWLPAATDDDS